MKTQSNIEDIDELKELLKENILLFNDQKSVHYLVQIMAVIIGLFLGAVISSQIFQSTIFVFFFSLVLAGIAYLISLFFQTISAYMVDSSIVYLKAIILKNWKILYTNTNTHEQWEEFSSKYPYINLGDTNNSIPICVEGSFKTFHFSYFEYDYTIEYEEEVEHEDSDGNSYNETEYYEETYTQTCLAIDIKSNLPVISIDSSSPNINTLKFSYIELNKRMSVYSNRTEEAYRFFTTQTQKLFVEFYKQFPYAQVSLQEDRLFINFNQDLTNIPRILNFDAKLISFMDSEFLAHNIENLLKSVDPLLSRILQYSSINELMHSQD